MFARVAFPSALPDALTYRVPDALDVLARPGVRVRARLRGVSRVGLIVERTEDPGCPLDKVVDLGEVLDAEPLIPAALLDLVTFAARYYAAPIGLVVRAAFPSSMLQLPPALLEAGPRAVELLPTLGTEARALVERLVEARRISLATLRAEGWDRERLDALVTELAPRRVLTKHDRRPRGAEGVTVTAVELVERTPAERAAAVARAPAQRRVLDWLGEHPGPVLDAELRAACGCSPGAIAELARKGLVRRFQQRRTEPRHRWELAPPPPVGALNAYQSKAYEALVATAARREFEAALLLGVTGSGKTEVYLRLAEEVVRSGRQAVVLVPEIGLTPQLAGQLAARFGDRVAVFHSSMAEGDRLVAWDRARRGEVDVVAGPRSALWVPLPSMGLIVVDEEQDPSYKQGEDPRYHARDLALVLGQRLAIPVVLASATPSLEALALVDQKRLALVELPERVPGAELPTVEILDLRGAEPDPGEHGTTMFSPRLKELLSEVLELDEQAILLVNRRGWAPVLLCRECGHQETCRDCSIPLTVHRRREALMCHYCGYSRAIPAACSRCGGAVLDHVGVGTEKVAARVRELFPAARVDILDRDTARSPARLLETLERFASGGSDILVGTQMVSKGHHFPKVTLTAVVNCDNLLGFPDFRGAERTFQLLTQVAGRSGRGPRRGTVLFQTYHPEHHAILAAATHQVAVFAREELRYRSAFRYPPFHRLVLIRWESEREAEAWKTAERETALVAPVPPGVRVVGPAAAPVARLRGRYRVQTLLFAPTRPLLREALERIQAATLPRSVRRVVDVDPQSTV